MLILTLFFYYKGNQVGMYNGEAGSYEFLKFDFNVSSRFNGQYHHFKATLSPSTRRLEIFIDGQSVATGTFSLDNQFDHDTDGLMIGRSPHQNDEFFNNGSIKNVYLYDRVLTAEEIATRYSVFQGTPPPLSPTNLIEMDKMIHEMLQKILVSEEL